ncbi:pentatricopeptide repeat-containing protein [Tanacetum coccineum]|uniref:Pentatricopeptide repeat-containing protein n=1 Tax=Tanacetum coccineum TaxID=301880 RepID=A0ABQ5A700_9ASTR
MFHTHRFTIYNNQHHLNSNIDNLIDPHQCRLMLVCDYHVRHLTANPSSSFPSHRNQTLTQRCTLAALCRKYDIKVSNVLLGGYIRNGLMEKSEGLHYRTLEKGGCPNYKTWDILIEGYVKNEDMEQAVFAMKNGFRMLKKCKWRPDPVIVESMLKYFRKNKNLEEAMKFNQDALWLNKNHLTGGG